MATRREQDNRLVDMVAARAAGMKPSEIGKKFGVGSQNVITATNAVMDDDIRDAKTEEPETVRAAYWPRKERGQDA